MATKARPLSDYRANSQYKGSSILQTFGRKSNKQVMKEGSPMLWQSPSSTFDNRQSFARTDGFSSGRKSKSHQFNKPYLNAKHLPSNLKNVLDAVQLPDNLIDVNEWLSMHIIFLMENSIMLSQLVSCSCTSMSAPNNTIFNWLDERGKKCKYSGLQYSNAAAIYFASISKNENVFPTKYGAVFPPDINIHLAKCCRIIFHLLAHLYHSHFPQLENLDFVLCQQLHTVFMHFLGLVPIAESLGSLKEDLLCLKDLIELFGDTTNTHISRHIWNEKS